MEFSRSDWKKLNQRFVQSKLPNASAEVKEAWKDISDVGGRSGKVAKQHAILSAWVIDPSCSDTFMNQSGKSQKKMALQVQSNGCLTKKFVRR